MNMESTYFCSHAAPDRVKNATDDIFYEIIQIKENVVFLASIDFGSCFLTSKVFPLVRVKSEDTFKYLQHVDWTNGWFRICI